MYSGGNARALESGIKKFIAKEYEIPRGGWGKKGKNIYESKQKDGEISKSGNKNNHGLYRYGKNTLILDKYVGLSTPRVGNGIHYGTRVLLCFPSTHQASPHFLCFYFRMQSLALRRVGRVLLLPPSKSPILFRLSSVPCPLKALGLLNRNQGRKLCLGVIPY